MAAADRETARASARRIAYGGLCAALALLALLGVRLLPTADFALYALTTLCVAVAVIETGLRGGTLCWLAAGVSGFLLAGAPSALPFLILFGPYALLKAVVEPRLPNPWVRQAVCLLIADLLLIPLGLLAVLVLDYNADMLPLPLWAVLLLAQPFLVLFDVAFRMLITTYGRYRDRR